MMSELDKLALGQSKGRLSAIKGVANVGDWVPVNAGHTIFALSVQLELLNLAPANDIPKYSNWSVVIDFRNDKWGKVQIHPSLGANAIINTYPHQQYNGSSHDFLPVRNGHICTLSSIHGLAVTKNALKTEPTHTIERITWHVERALEWLKAAASNSLLNCGDNFELPDFIIPKATQSLALAYYESADSYNIWSALSGQSGIALISMLNNTVIIRRYLNKSGSRTYYEPQWGDYVKSIKEQKAIWICLEQIPVVNSWQVPSTLQELVITGNAQNINIPSIIKEALENLNDNSECIVLVGMPVSNKVGEKPFRYHWQAFSLPAASKVKSAKIRAQLVVNHLTSRYPIPIKWFSVSENWHPSDLQNRGRVDKTLQELDILLIGCGAFGSIISDLLVRMGVNKLTLVDKELFESGNIVRHVLTVNHINKSKAVELAKHLNTVNPSATIKGLALSIPINDKNLLEVIGKASLIIDCSADDEIMSELPFPGLNLGAKIISCSMGLHADRLFFYADNVDSFNGADFNRWFQPFREKEHAIAENEELPRGAGCWNPITPAKLNRISGLAGVAVELIEQIIIEKISNPIAICHDWNVPQLNLEPKIKVA